MQFLVIVFPNYLNFATLSKNLSDIFKLWFYGFVIPHSQKKQSVQSPLSKPQILSITIVGFKLGIRS